MVWAEHNTAAKIITVKSHFTERIGNHDNKRAAFRKAPLQ